MLLSVNYFSNKIFWTVSRVIIINRLAAHHKRSVLEINSLVFIIILTFSYSNCLPVRNCRLYLILNFSNFNCIILNEWKGLLFDFNKFLCPLFCFFSCLLDLLELRATLNYCFRQNFIQFLSDLNLISRRLRIRSWKSWILVFTFVRHKLSDSFLDNIFAIMVTLILTEITFTGLDQTDCNSLEILWLEYFNFSIDFTSKKRRFNRKYVRISCHWEYDCSCGGHFVPGYTKRAKGKIKLWILLA